jgi:hypothetical protein
MAANNIFLKGIYNTKPVYYYYYAEYGLSPLVS